MYAAHYWEITRLYNYMAFCHFTVFVVPSKYLSRFRGNREYNQVTIRVQTFTDFCTVVLKYLSGCVRHIWERITSNRAKHITFNHSTLITARKHWSRFHREKKWVRNNHKELVGYYTQDKYLSVRQKCIKCKQLRMNN